MPKNINQLTVNTAVAVGTEKIPVWKDGATYSMTIDKILDGRFPYSNTGDRRTVYVSKSSAATDSRGSYSAYDPDHPFATVQGAYNALKAIFPTGSAVDNTVIQVGPGDFSLPGPDGDNPLGGLMIEGSLLNSHNVTIRGSGLQTVLTPTSGSLAFLMKDANALYLEDLQITAGVKVSGAATLFMKNVVAATLGYQDLTATSAIVADPTSSVVLFGGNFLYGFSNSITVTSSTLDVYTFGVSFAMNAVGAGVNLLSASGLITP